MISGRMRIAIIGATGLVGRKMLSELITSRLYNAGRVAEVGLFASERSHGTKLTAGLAPGKDEAGQYTGYVEAFSVEKLRGYDVALMSAGGDFSQRYSIQLSRLGVVIIDNSSAWRQHPAVPLVVPEVNADSLTSAAGAEDFAPGMIIANPNCSTIQMMVNVAPLHRLFGIRKIIVSTYQSVSGSGVKGLAELDTQYAQMAEGRRASCDFYPEPIAGNVLACIGEISQQGHAWEEVKMMLESQKILAKEDLVVMATAVRVPVAYGHGQMVVCELEKEVKRTEVYEALQDAAGLVVQKDGEGVVVSPLQIKDQRKTYVSRIRLASSQICDQSQQSSRAAGHETEERSSWVQMWNVADNLTKGAATNAVQILESLAL